MKHKVFCCLAVCVLLLAGSMQGRANPAAYTIKDLGTLGGGDSRAYSINDRGQVVGGSTTTGSITHAFLYDGIMHDLGTLPGGNSSVAYGINDRGQVVGQSYASSSGEGHAFLYDGTMHDLGTLGGRNSYARDINNSGQVVGYSSTSSGTHAFLYDGTMHDLGTLPGGYSSYAEGINDRGQVMGCAITNSVDYHTFLYDVTMHDLGTLGGVGSYAVDINNNGKVVGTILTSITPSYSWHAYLYDGTIHDLGTLSDGFDSEAYGINDFDQVVGTAYNRGGNEFAWVWHNGSMIDLNTVVDLDDDWSYLQWAEAINNAGQIAGTGITKNGDSHAFLLTPVPEPSSLLALVAGLGGLGILYRRRK